MHQYKLKEHVLIFFLTYIAIQQCGTVIQWIICALKNEAHSLIKCNLLTDDKDNFIIHPLYMNNLDEKQM